MADYAKNWDAYYRRTYQLMKSKSLWEVAPEEGVGPHLDLLKKECAPTLPFFDVGCGTGEQAHYLRDFFPNVVGLDVAETALRIARERYSDTDLRFLQFDIANTAQAAELQREYERVNMFIRGVLHQTLPADRANIQDNLAMLLGKQGKLLLVEVADDIRAHLQSRVPSFNDLPTRMRQALMSNLPPVGLSEQTLHQWFPSSTFKLDHIEKTFLATNLVLPSGERLQIPAIQVLVSVS